MGNARWSMVAMLLVVGCGEKQARETPASTEAAPATRQKLALPPAEAVKTQASVALPQIAYSYDFTLELPAASVVPLFERHRKACEAAGPARCQIVGAETETVAGTDTSATLALRAESGWLAAFRSRLTSDAQGADGRIAASRTASEDLGRQISDSGARLRALTTLQARLEALLANRTGKLGDLLEIERELARVGGEIDATRSALADMGGRVTLPRATINYRPDSLAVAGAGAGSGLGGQLYAVTTTSLFALLNLIAALLPWLVILVPLGWLVRRVLRRRRATDV